MTTHELLLKKFPPGECALLAEVSDGAGFDRSRSLDFLVMNLWPSRGLSLTGIERKSHRSDWLKEMRNPAKQETVFKYCDYFYLLTDKDKVAQLEEIPETWGWYHVQSNKIVTMKEAPRLKPQEITRNFLAALLKRGCSKDGYVLRDSIKGEIDKAIEQYKYSAERNQSWEMKRYEELKEEVKTFEDACGIRFGSWQFSIKKVASAIKFIADGGLPKLLKDLETARIISSKAVTESDRVLSELKEINFETLMQTPEED